MVTVRLPGTGGMQPLENRWLACCWIEYQGKALLIDCGEGTQIALKKAGCSLSRIEQLLITHFHADHIAGLPGLLLTIGNTGKTSPLVIAGPRGLQAVVSALCVIAPRLPYEVLLAELAPGDVLPGWDGLETICQPLRHWIDCYGYRISVKRKPVFDPEKAAALQIPPPYYRRLHAGESVTLPDGRVIMPEQVIDRPRPPIVVSYCTDTLPVQRIAELSRDADLMIAEGMYGDDTLGEKAHEKTHMLFSEAACLAREANAKKLCLTHFSPSVKNPEEFADSARIHFPETVISTDGMEFILTGD